MIKRLVPVLSLCGALLFPLSSFAATSQQLLDTSLRALVTNAHAATNIAVDMAINSTKKVLVKETGASAGNAKAQLVFTIDSFKRGATSSDSIITLHVPHFTIDMGSGQKYDIKNPLTIEVRQISSVVYVRVSDVSPLLLTQLPRVTHSSDFDVRSLIGTWIKLDSGDFTDAASMISPLSVTTALEGKDDLAQLKQILAKSSLFQVTSLEKRMKNAKGEELLRLRVRIHPGLVDQFVNIQSEQQKKLTGKAMTTRERSTAKTTVRALLKPFQFVTMVNSKTGALERLEGSYIKTEPVYRYVWKKNKSVKIYNGTSRDDIRFGISLKALPNREVPVPANALSLKGLIDQWTAANTPIPAPEPQEAPEPIVPDTYNYDDSYVDPVYPPVAPVSSADHIRGNPQAPVTMILYSDFECPFCARHLPSVTRILTEFPQDVRLVYRQYPLTSIHPQAQAAAEASECAGRVGGSSVFWSMHDLLFQNTAQLDTISVTSLASRIELNPSAFKSCMDNHEGAGKVHQDLLTGGDAGVDGTPATFVNGKLVSGAVPYATLRQEVVSAGARY